MSELDRREMLAALASVPLALAVPKEEVERAAAHAHDVVEAEELAVQQGRQPAPYAPKHFTADEYRLVRLLVDYVIPRDARSGSATQAGVPQFMDFMLGENAGMRTWMRDGLSWVNAECRRRFNQGFISCTEPQRKALLDAIACPAKALAEDGPGVEFFNRFRNLTSSGFWTSRMGIADLGYTGNRPVSEWVGTPRNVLTWLERNKPA